MLLHFSIWLKQVKYDLNIVKMYYHTEIISLRQDIQVINIDKHGSTIQFFDQSNLLNVSQN